MSPLSQNPLAIEHALLGFLQAGPLHGYELYRRVCDLAGLGVVWHVKQPHLYALLARLEAHGLVASFRQPQHTRPARKVLRLTPAGQAAFAHWRESPVEHGRELRVEFLAKLFFARQAGPAAAAQLVAAQRQAVERWLAAPPPGRAAEGGAPVFAGWVQQYRHGQMQAMLAWLETLEQSLAIEPAPGRTPAPESIA